MKNIKDIASGGKFVPWESLAGPIDENFAELNNGKLSKSELAQTTGSSTTTAMSQNAVTNVLSQKIGQLDLAQGLGEYKTVAMSQDSITKALAGLLPNQRADKTPYISVTINDGDSGQNWETFNRKLDEIASMPDPMPYNGDIRYFISEGLRVDVTNRIFDSSEGTSRRLTQVVTGNVRLDDRLDLALNGDIDQSFWRIYKDGAWSEWKSVNSGGGSGNVDVVQETGSSLTAVMSQNAVTNEFKKRDNFYFTTLDVTYIDDGSSVSDVEAQELANIQRALASQKTIISPSGVLAAFVTYRNSLYIARISYVVGSELRILSTATPKTGGGNWAVITKDMSTQSDIISVQGLDDIISSGTASKEDIERIFGTSDFDELSAKLLGKIIVDQKDTYADPYIASVFGNSSTLGVITIARAGIKSTAPNNRPFISISYAWGNFSQCNTGKVVTIEDAPSDNTAYERQDGKWVKRSYYTDGDLGLIKSTGDYDKLNSALGDHNLFMNAVASGLRIFSNDFSAPDGVYKTNTEIMYQKRDDLMLLELSWVVNGVMTLMTVDTSDDWGDITEFKQVDLKNISGTTDKKIVSWDISNIISRLKSGSNVTAGSYIAPEITPTQLRDIVLVGVTNTNLDTGASTYLSAQKEHVGDEYILWLSYIAKDKLIRFGVSLGPSAASWGDINASNYKEITIG